MHGTGLLLWTKGIDVPKSSTSPTQRTLKLCRDTGWTAAVVEKWNMHAKVRQDLFGCIDVLAMNGVGFVGIQSTSGSNVSARLKKIAENEHAAEWLKCGGRILIHGWRKLAKSKRWECREVEVTLEMLATGGEP